MLTTGQDVPYEQLQQISWLHPDLEPLFHTTTNLRKVRKQYHEQSPDQDLHWLYRSLLEFVHL